jgi:hypothetical protein
MAEADDFTHRTFIDLKFLQSSSDSVARRNAGYHPRTLTSVSSWIGMYLPIVMMLVLLF